MLFGIEGRQNEFDWTEFARYADGYMGLTSVQRATSDKQGCLWFCEDPAKKETLFIFAPGLERRVIRPGERPRPDAESRCPVTLRPEARIKGSLADAGSTTGSVKMHLNKLEPVHSAPGQTVTMLKPELQRKPEWEDSTRTLDGHFVFDRLPEGDYSVYAEIPTSAFTAESSTATIVRLQAGASKTLQGIKSNHGTH